MATTKVQSALQSAGNSKAFTSNVVAGNLLTARIVWQGAAGITLNSVTDTQGNTWTIHASTLQRQTTLTQYMQIASCVAGSSAACTVTATLSSGTAKSIAIDEWNNAAGGLVFDVGSANSGVSSTLNSGSATTTAANGFGISQCAADASLGGAFTTPDSGWTDQQAYTPYWYANDLYQLDLGATGSKSAGEAIVSGASKNWACNFAAFKVSAASGNGVGSASGAGAASGVGASVNAQSGSASGVGAVAGVGSGINAQAGSSSGSSTVSGVGASDFSGVGSSSGTSTADGVGTSSTGSFGTASGTSSANAIGASTVDSVGSGNGVASVSGVSASEAATVASASGSSTVSGVGDSIVPGSTVGTASGSSSASGVGASIVAAVGAADGSAVVVGKGASSGGDVEYFSGGYISREERAERVRKQRIELGIIEEDKEQPTLEQFEISNLVDKKPVLVPALKKTEKRIIALEQERIKRNEELKRLIQLELDREEEQIIRLLMEM